MVEHQGVDGVVYRSLRFHAYGKRRYLAVGPISRDEAERALRGVLADVERGRWKPAAPVAATEPISVPTFHEYAEEWWLLHKDQWRPATVTDYRWRLEGHLLPVFAALPLDQIDVGDVDRYKATKLAEAVLSPPTINQTLVLLAAILEHARRRRIIVHNAARDAGKLRVRHGARSYLDTAEQITALLDAAGRLDRTARSNTRHVERRAIVATLAFSGVRIGELVALRWRDVDLAAAWLTVAGTKTDAGARRVKFRPALHDELAAVRARTAFGGARDPVFVTRSGKPHTTDNVRHRVINAAVKTADLQRDKADLPPLPERTTPHSLRRTFASLLYALGESPAVVMAEMGHSHPGLALRIYAQAMRRDESELDRLRALINGAEWADVGRRDAESDAAEAEERDSRNDESPAPTGDPKQADEGTRTLDLLHGKQTL